jgi:ubiquitin-protein ligase E3 A
LKADRAKGELHIHFDGEPGIDVGGVRREFFSIVTQQLFSPDFAMFEIIADKFYWFARNSFEGPGTYEALGTFLALAVFNAVYLPIRFPRLLYKKLLELPLTLVDLGELDQSIANSVQMLIDSRERGENIEDMGLTFAITVSEFGENSDIPFFVGGEQTKVTNTNLDQYVEYLTSYHLHGSVAAQFQAFAVGFAKCCDHPLFRCFTPAELDVLVSGEMSYDWDAFKEGARYRGCTAIAPQVLWFWEVFSEFDEEKKKKFLFFVTGSDLAPIGGLKAVRFRIDASHNKAKLPKSHTCFSALVLPPYDSKDELRRKLDISIANSIGFGLK